MLSRLSIRNIVLIESCDIDLKRGLCVLSGETGAGKSILLDALGLVLGAASFCAFRVAVASLIRNSEAAPAVVQLVLFPPLFISGTYMPIHSGGLNRVAGAWPVRPFNQALLGPFAQHTGFDWKSLGVLAAGALVAIRRFRWDPRPG